MSLLWVLLLLLPMSAAQAGAENPMKRWAVTVTEDPDSTEADSIAFEDEEDEPLEDKTLDDADSSHAEAPAFTDSAFTALESVADTTTLPAPERSWEAAASMTGYFGPSRDPYAVPVLGIEHQGLYMEARYNYEDFETGSVFLGWHFEVGDEFLGADITPIFGAVFGRIDGVAPGLLFEMNIDQCVLQSELEYVVLNEASSESFVYNHSELSYQLDSGLSFGILAEHAKTRGDSNRDFVPGFLAGMEGGRLIATFYLFYLDEDEATGAIELEFGF